MEERRSGLEWWYVLQEAASRKEIAWSSGSANGAIGYQRKFGGDVGGIGTDSGAKAGQR